MALGTDWIAARPIAHRGLHDAARPENSLAAFRAAVEHGFAIECDVLLSKDGVPMVFHDHPLARLTGADGLIGGRSAAELRELRLLGTDEPIPTVAALLALVADRVPIVMELKGLSPDADADMLSRLAPVLDRYDGRLALMSFDGWLIDGCLGYGKRAVGLTAEGTREVDLVAHRALFDRGCAFASYNVRDLPNAFTTYVRHERRAPVITWTVRDAAGVAATEAHGDQMTFEGFLPQS